LKTPYSQLVEFCIYDKQDNDKILDWFNLKLGLPIDAFVVDEIRKDVEFPKNKKTKGYKEAKAYSNDLVNYVGERTAIVEGIVNGFGRKEIFNDLIALLSNVDITKKVVFSLLNKKYRVDLNEYSELIDVIFYTEDWTYMDWDTYFRYLDEQKAVTMTNALKAARFSSKEDLIYALGIGGSSVEEGVIMAVRKSKEMFMGLSENTRADTIKAIGEAHGKMQSAYISMKKEGMLDEGDGSVSNLKFAIDKSTYDKIDTPKFEELMDDEEYIGG